ncbi:hypothetical protein [Saccharothrix xinjiangensis]|uniref:DGQHR domain-containing protein n=1 Tax=Saccharothrix xinjiangensis TaxID=204798 RepID=A0ABV9Y7Z5_9PSEU
MPVNFPSLEGRELKFPSGNEEILSGIYILTPEVATEILGRNIDNRPLDRHTVEMYASAMVRGEWKLSHQGIAVDHQGVLLDGQHRLAAVVKSGKSVPMLVIRGVQRDTFSVVDTGKRRSAGDTLRLTGAQDTNHLAAALRYLYMYETLPKDIGSWSGGRTRTTNDQILELSKTHPGMLDCVRRARPLAANTGIIASACATGIYLTERAAPKINSEEWFSGILTGANLDLGDPRLAFRNFFVNGRAQAGRRRMNAREHLAIYIKGWNDWVNGESRKLIAFRKGETMPTPVERNN